MEIYDISVPISTETPIYQGDPGVEIIPASRISAGQSSNVSLLKFGDHTATHVDPPYHFCENGMTIDQIPLDSMMGECLVCPIPDAPSIGVRELEAARIPEGTTRILFKTRNSNLWVKSEFQKDFTYLEPEGADWLVNLGIRLIGIDYLSIDKFKSGTHQAHFKLLDAGIIVIEGICLADVPGGIYTLLCLPLKIKGGDGGPARAVLIRH